MKKDIATIILLFLTTFLVGIKLFIAPGISWWWVFSPLWIPCAFGVVAFLAVVLFFGWHDKR